MRHNAGNILGGFLTAGILAAIMSSLDSQFLCLGTIFTNDIALHYSKRKIHRQAARSSPPACLSSPSWPLPTDSAWRNRGECFRWECGASAASRHCFH